MKNIILFFFLIAPLCADAFHHHTAGRLSSNDYYYTRPAAEKLRPEVAGLNADNAGFGTFFFSLEESR